MSLVPNIEKSAAILLPGEIVAIFNSTTFTRLYHGIAVPSVKRRLTPTGAISFLQGICKNSKSNKGPYRKIKELMKNGFHITKNMVTFFDSTLNIKTGLYSKTIFNDICPEQQPSSTIIPINTPTVVYNGSNNNELLTIDDYSINIGGLCLSGNKQFVLEAVIAIYNENK